MNRIPTKALIPVLLLLVAMVATCQACRGCHDDRRAYQAPTGSNSGWGPSYPQQPAVAPAAPVQNHYHGGSSGLDSWVPLMLMNSANQGSRTVERHYINDSSPSYAQPPQRAADQPTMAPPSQGRYSSDGSSSRAYERQSAPRSGTYSSGGSSTRRYSSGSSSGSSRYSSSRSGSGSSSSRTPYKRQSK